MFFDLLFSLLLSSITHVRRFDHPSPSRMMHHRAVLRHPVRHPMRHWRGRGEVSAAAAEVVAAIVSMACVPELELCLIAPEASPNGWGALLGSGGGEGSHMQTSFGSASQLAHLPSPAPVELTDVSGTSTSTSRLRCGGRANGRGAIIEFGVCRWVGGAQIEPEEQTSRRKEGSLAPPP